MTQVSGDNDGPRATADDMDEPVGAPASGDTRQEKLDAREKQKASRERERAADRAGQQPGAAAIDARLVQLSDEDLPNERLYRLYRRAGPMRRRLRQLRLGVHCGRPSAGDGEVHSSRSRLRGAVPLHVGIACARHAVHARFLRPVRANLRCMRRRMQPSYREPLPGVQRRVPEVRGGLPGDVRHGSKPGSRAELIHSFCVQLCGQARDPLAIHLTRQTNFPASECASPHGARRASMLSSPTNTKWG